jgi:hypothetical protein
MRPGIRVDFSSQIRHPETVDHIVGAQRDFYRHAGRDADFIGCGDELFAVVAIMHIPPPLVSDYFDLYRRIVESGAQIAHFNDAVDQ